MNTKNSKKIVILGIFLLILAGIIIVALKGFNVSLLFGKHEEIELKIGSEVNLKDFEEICDETFANKDYVIKGVEVFNDSVQINVKSLTDEEKENLINKINEKLGLEKTVDDLNIYSVSNKRIRDIVKPYIMPMLISFGIVFGYMLIRYHKKNGLKKVIKTIINVALVEAICLSIIAIIRVPVNEIVINILMLTSIFVLIYNISKNEKEFETEK